MTGDSSYLFVVVLGVLVSLARRRVELLARPVAQDVLHVAVDDGRLAAGREAAQLTGSPLRVSLAALAHFSAGPLGKCHMSRPVRFTARPARVCQSSPARSRLKSNETEQLSMLIV